MCTYQLEYARSIFGVSNIAHCQGTLGHWTAHFNHLYLLYSEPCTYILFNKILKFQMHKRYFHWSLSFSIRKCWERGAWVSIKPPHARLPGPLPSYLANAWVFTACLSSCSATFLFKLSTSSRRAAECSISPSSRFRRDLEGGGPFCSDAVNHRAQNTDIYLSQVLIHSFSTGLYINHNSSLSHMNSFKEVPNSAQKPQNNN